MQVGMEELRGKLADDGVVALCRCYKSQRSGRFSQCFELEAVCAACRFPYCDGSHNEHNKITGDNAGPVVIKALEKKTKL